MAKEEDNEEEEDVDNTTIAENFKNEEDEEKYYLQIVDEGLKMAHEGLKKAEFGRLKLKKLYQKRQLKISITRVSIFKFSLFQNPNILF